MSIALSNLKRDFYELVVSKIGVDFDKEFQKFLEHIKKDHIKGVNVFFTEYCKDMGVITGEESANEYKNCLVSIFTDKVKMLNESNY